MKKVTCLLLLVCFVISGAIGQVWMDLLPAEKRQTANFYDICAAYYQLQKLNGGIPLRGDKQFKRLEWFLKTRINEKGEFPVDIFWSEGKKVMENRSNRDFGYGDWSCLGPFVAPTVISGGRRGGVGRIDCISFHPTKPYVIYVCSPSGGLWKTSDGGFNWTPLTDALPTLGASDLAIDPLHPDTVYLATGTRDVWWETYSVGVLKSYDGGFTWQETGLSFSIQQFKQVSRLLINPDDPNVLLAATSSGIYRTNDAGDNWDLVYPGNFKDMAYRPGDFSVIYATTFNYYGGASLYQSTDSGESFTQVTNTGFASSAVNRITIGVTPANPDVVYLLCSDKTNSGFYGIYRSDNNGKTWTHTSASTNLNLLGWNANGMDAGGQGWFTLALAVDPYNPDKIYVGGVNIWESSDMGATWQINAHWLGQGGADYVHADIHTLTYNHINDVLYTGTDGGIYLYNQTQDDWNDISDGLVIYQLYRLGLYPESDDLAIASPQDNGTTLFKDGTLKEIVLAEACDNFFDYTNSDILYYGGYGAGLLRSDNGGWYYTSIHPQGATNLIFNPPFIMDPIEPQTLYSGFTEIYKSTNQGGQWTTLTNGLSNGQYYSSLEVAETDQNYIYIATAGIIWRTKDAGTSWDQIKQGLPGSIPINDIAISTINPEHIWVTMGGFNMGQKVYRSYDAGDTWENISLNLPNVPANCTVHENGTNDGIYVGTDLGIFYTNNDLSEWVDFSEGLPNVIVLELEINYLSGKIKAATYGRGLWESPLMSPYVYTEEYSFITGFKAYPNPANQTLNIELFLDLDQKINIILHDILNKAVFQETCTVQGAIHRQIDLNGIAEGLYILRVSSGEKWISKKIIVRN